MLPIKGKDCELSQKKKYVCERRNSINRIRYLSIVLSGNMLNMLHSFTNTIKAEFRYLIPFNEGFYIMSRQQEFC